MIEGDIATDQDAERVRRQGVPAVQINTHGDCHLDARMVAGALDRLAEEIDLARLDLLLVENVGNLVCPTEFDLGETRRSSSPRCRRAHDKPSKYPATFFAAGAMVVNKIDLLPYVDCDLDRLIGDARAINGHARRLPALLPDWRGARRVDRLAGSGIWARALTPVTRRRQLLPPLPTAALLHEAVLQQGPERREAVLPADLLALVVVRARRS